MHRNCHLDRAFSLLPRRRLGRMQCPVPSLVWTELEEGHQRPVAASGTCRKQTVADRTPLKLRQNSFYLYSIHSKDINKIVVDFLKEFPYKAIHLSNRPARLWARASTRQAIVPHAPTGSL